MPVNYWQQQVFTSSQFEALLICFNYHWKEYYSQYTLEGKPCQRISYNRKTSQFPLIEDKLLFILVYLKTNPLQEVQAVHFEMTQPQANFWIHLLAKILSKTLRTLGELPDRNSKRIVHLLSECESVLLDGTERPIVHPCQEDRQASCYSGKTHT